MNNTMTQEYFDDLLDKSEYAVDTVFENTHILACKLPNGYVISEALTCDDEEFALDVCMQKIEARLYDMEMYKNFKPHFDSELN